MKVLILHNRYRPTAPSGENVVVDQEAAALAERGHEVVVEQRHSEEVASWSVVRRATLPARVLWSETSRRTLASSLAEHRPDVVHVHNLFPLLTPSVLHACRDAGVPVVASIHNYKLGCANGELFRDGRVCHDCLGHPTSLPAVTHGCYRGSSLATAPVALGMLLHARAWRTMVSAYAFLSSAQRDLLAPVGLPAERSFVKGNFVPAATPTGGTTEHQVAFVARLDEAKGARLVMRAWDLYRARRPRSTLRLVVAGGGALAEELEVWAHGRASVRMAGRLPRTEVSALMASSRAVLAPSQWEETFGMVAVEAMAAGTAPVATMHGAFPEIITPGVDGALFGAHDVEGLVDVLADVDEQPARWDAYGQRARETYAARFSPEVGLARLEEIYAFATTHPVHAAEEDLGAPTDAGSSLLAREIT